MSVCKYLNEKFCHLHLHTEYSPQDAPVGLKQMVEYAKHLGYKSIAVTDHGTIASWVKFQELCQKNGVKPIFGVEAYFTPDRHVRRSRKDNYHQLLLAKNNQGIKNIYKMTELSFSDGYYYDPRIDWDLLEKYHEGVICTSTCVSGIVPETWANGDHDQARQHARRFRSIFGDDFYMEVQFHGLEIEESYYGVAQIASEEGIKVVGTNDVHYLRQEDHNLQDALMALNMGRCIKDPKRIRHAMNQFYLKSPDEMIEQFGGKNRQLVQSTLEIMDKCDAQIEMGKTQLPSVDVPEGMTDFEYLEQQSWEGLKARNLHTKQRYRDRLQEELALVKKLREDKGLRFDRYFLVVADYVDWAWNNGVRVGAGRGSGAGSLILYCLRITGLDPLKYDLLFERFLAEDRVQMPDIDIDFDAEYGHKLFDYLDQKYGRERWARIGTIQTFQSAGALKAAYRVYDPGNTFDAKMAEKNKEDKKKKKTKKRKAKFQRQKKSVQFRDETAKLADEASKLLPRSHANDKAPNPLCTLRKEISEADPERIYVFDSVPQLKNLREANPEMFNFAIHLEGLVSGRGVHAAGVLITDTPISEFAPQQYSGQKNLATSFDMEDVEKIGGIKFDFLQTKVLSVLTRAVSLIKLRTGKTVPIDDLEPDDPKVLSIFARGDTDAIFQFEGNGMKDTLRSMQPDCFEDLIAANALFRPGPMQYIEDYCNRKHGRRQVSYAVDVLEPILKPTYGIMVYQEQVMKIVRVLAGFTASESDTVRKAMGKKKKDILEKMHEKFLKGCEKEGTCSKEVATKIWSDMEEFAKYAFNKSHAAAYSYIAYQCAYLKCYYPAEFMAAQLSVEGGDSKYEAVEKYERRANAMGIRVLPLDINKSKADYVVVDKGDKTYLLRGFKGVKGVGQNAYKDILANQPYRDMYDFCLRAGNGNKSDVVKRLIEARGFDWLIPQLSKRRKDGTPAGHPDIEREYNICSNRAKAEKNVKGAQKEERDGIEMVFSMEATKDNFKLSVEDF